MAGLRILLGDELLAIFTAIYIDQTSKREVAVEHRLSMQELDSACAEIERRVNEWTENKTNE